MTNKNVFCVTMRKGTDAEILRKFDIFSETKKISRLPFLLLKVTKANYFIFTIHASSKKENSALCRNT